jgi:hypothetical protein
MLLTTTPEFTDYSMVSTGCHVLNIPDQFLELDTQYELEVLVLEVCGNQTITNLHFKTKWSPSLALSRHPRRTTGPLFRASRT